MRERLTTLRLRLQALARRRRLDRDLRDEIAFHLAMKEDAHRAAGETPADAHAHARRQFGSPLRVTESLRELWQGRALDHACQDLRFAARAARRQPGFTLVVVLTLALGIGAATAMFSIVDSVMLRPFPFAAPDQLVVAWETNRARNIHTFSGSIANYVDWQRNATAFADLGFWETRADNRTDGPRPEQVQGAVASSAFFRALKLEPALGRFFRRDEDEPRNRHVAVLGHEYWQRAFQGDRGVINRAVVVNGTPHTIVGVAPPLRAPFRADIWRPLAPDAAALDRGDHTGLVVGRLADGQSMARAEAELQTIARRLEAAYPDTNRGWNVRVESLFATVVVQTTRRAMAILLGAVGLLLLIACVNVANLMLARAAGRQREIATRLALGAARGRIVRQLLTESAFLACAGGAAGLAVAAWGLRLAQRFYPADIPGLAEARLNPFALVIAMLLALVTTVLVGLVPALQLSRLSLRSGAGQSTRGATDPPRTRRLRHALVVAEIAFALVLLVGAGLLLRSVDRLRHAPLGFVPEQVFTTKVGLYDRAYDSHAAYATFIDRLLRDLRARPGVGAVGVGSSVPLGGGYTSMAAWHERDRGKAGVNGLQTHWRVIGGDYFAAVGIPFLMGRPFTDADDGTREPRVTIVSETLARRLWPGENPIGKRLLASDSQRPYEVVGVVGHARLTGLAEDPKPVMYFHYPQFGWRSMTIAVRTASGDPARLESTVRSAVAAIDRTQPIFESRTMTELVADAGAGARMNAALLTLFAALALTLSAIGVYGVMSYSAAQRTNEIGLRLALGARPRDVLRLIWARGLALTAIGLGVGLAAALLAGRALGALLYEVSAVDPPTYLAGLVVMLAVALLACYVPARRAMKIDAMTALRHE